MIVYDEMIRLYSTGSYGDNTRCICVIGSICIQDVVIRRLATEFSLTN